MSNMNLDDKQLLEKINREYCNDVDRVPEGIRPENMMRYIMELKKEGCFEERNEGANMKKEVIKNKRNKKKIIAMVTGAASTVAVACMSIVIALQGSGEGVTGDKYYDYSDDLKSAMMKENNSGVYTLNSYKELAEYNIAMNAISKNDMDIGYGGIIVDESVVMEESKNESSVERGDYPENMGVDGDSLSGDSSTDNQKYSDTNTRTEGVAEADIVKTDGQYIYYYKDNYSEFEKNMKIRIVKADGASSEAVAEIDVASDVREILGEAYLELRDDRDYNIMSYKTEIIIDGDKLLVVTQPSGVFVLEDGVRVDVHYSGDKEIDADFSDFTVVLTYDITDRTQPVLLSKLTLEGSYDSCRMVDGYAYIFTDIVKKMSLDEETEVTTEEEAEELLAPTVCGEALAPEDVYVTNCEKYNNYYMVAALDLNNPEEFYNVKSFLGENGRVDKYVSANHIYFITDMYDEYKEYLTGNEDTVSFEMKEQSEICRLSYDNGEIEATGSTVIEGRLGDEFDIDEYNGYLRMAVSASRYDVTYRKVDVEYIYDGQVTSDVQWISSYSGEDIFEGSSLHVLDENLELVGSIPKLQENEEVYGVRFDGDIAYVVTYRQTDPLFTIDLSDPSNPKVMGALKIPGFSTYLHKWDDNKLIGLGYDSNGYVKVSTFDISDKYDVKETDVYVLEDVYYSDALYNHRAVFINPEKNLIGLDTVIYDYIENDVVYKIFSYVDGALTEVLACHMGEQLEENRGMYIGDYIYIVNVSGGVYVYDMATYEFIGHVE